MAAIDRDSVVRDLAGLGFDLLVPRRRTDPVKTLREVITLGDARFLEGVPVVLANCSSQPASDHYLDWERLRASFDRGPESEKCDFGELLYGALLVLKLYGEQEELWAEIEEFVSWSGLSDQKREEIKGVFENSESLDLFRSSVSTARMKDLFRTYVVEAGQREAASLREKLETQRELSTEFHLSRLFTKKQKELIKKKLAGETLTKTEGEYFSRTVKKRLAAILDPDVQDIARLLTER